MSQTCLPLTVHRCNCNVGPSQKTKASFVIRCQVNSMVTEKVALHHDVNKKNPKNKQKKGALINDTENSSLKLSATMLRYMENTVGTDNKIKIGF